MARLPGGTRKRADGSFEKRFTVNGKRYSVYGRSAQEIAQKEKEQREKIEKGSYTRNNNLTMDQYFQEWESSKLSSVKQSTMNVYRSRYKNYIAPYFGNKKIAKIERREIVDFQNKLIAENVSPNAINYALKVIKCILSDAVKDEIISADPSENIRRIKEDTTQKASETIHRALTEEEQRAFMEEVKTDYYYEFFAFLLTTGMRIGEAAAITWKDIDYINGCIHVNKTISVGKGGALCVNTPKTATSRRDIPLTETHKKILREARTKCSLVKGTLNLKMDDNIFYTCNGNIITSSGANYTIKKVLQILEKKGTNIDYFSCHAFRDTFATRYIEQGGTPQTLKTILGHSSITMTMDLYAHVLPNKKADEMNSLIIAI